MENKLKDEFFTQEQLQSIIHVSIDEILWGVNEYIYYDGILIEIPIGADDVVAYVNGYIKVKKELLKCEGDYVKKSDGSYKYSYFYECGNYCSRPDLIGTTDLMASSSHVDEDQQIYFNYSEFTERCFQVGLTCKDKSEMKFINSLKYNPKLVDQKSNFTLYEACEIAANPPVNFTGQSHSSLHGITTNASHYLEILNECVKGQNQDNFHLITRELWVYSKADSGHDTSTQYDNGTRLNISACVNNYMTIISKGELVRWCKYMDIETGLSCNQKDVDESVEALLLKNEKLEKQIKEQKMEIIGLNIDLEWMSIPVKKSHDSYPPELQLAIDAFEELCLDQDKRPTNRDIEKWLQFESKKRNITHKDGGKELQGMSNKKLETIPSIIKSQ